MHWDLGISESCSLSFLSASTLKCRNALSFGFTSPTHLNTAQFFNLIVFVFELTAIDLIWSKYLKIDCLESNMNLEVYNYKIWGSSTILGVSNKNLGVSNENMWSSTRIWGFQIIKYGGLRLKYSGLQPESGDLKWKYGVLIRKYRGLQRTFKVFCWNLRVCIKKYQPESGGLQLKSEGRHSPMKIWGSPTRLWGLQQNSGISNENLGVSNKNLGVSNKTSMRVSNRTPIELHWWLFLPELNCLTNWSWNFQPCS